MGRLNMLERPSPHTTSLETFDPLALLFMLGRTQRSGTLRITQERGELQVALRQGRIQNALYGDRRGSSALAVVASDPSGHFSFEDTVPLRGPLDLPVEAFALAALRELPPPEVLFDGPGRLSEGTTEANLMLTERERLCLTEIQAGTPLTRLMASMDARALAARLIRLGVLVPRKARTARLTLTLDRGGSKTAELDEIIVARWSDDTGAPVRKVMVKTDSGQVVAFAVRARPNLGTALVLPREWLMQHGLRSGESVLVRPH